MYRYSYLFRKLQKLKQRSCSSANYQECMSGYLVANGTNFTDVYFFNNSLDSIIINNGLVCIHFVCQSLLTLIDIEYHIEY